MERNYHTIRAFLEYLFNQLTYFEFFTYEAKRRCTLFFLNQTPQNRFLSGRRTFYEYCLCQTRLFPQASQQQFLICSRLLQQKSKCFGCHELTLNDKYESF